MQKLYGIFALTDETYGITCTSEGKKLTGAEISLLQVISHLWWVGATLIGALIGTLIPPEITGFEFALTAMFVTLAIDAVRHTVDNKLITYAVISSVFGVLMEYYVVNNAFLAAGLICYLSLISKDYIYSREEAIINDI